jgi:hypothetical protein
VTTSADGGYDQEVNRVKSGPQTRRSRDSRPVEVVQSIIGLASGYFFLEVSSLWSRILILLLQGIVIIVVVISEGPKDDGSRGGGGDPKPPRNPLWRAILIQVATFLGGIAVNYAWDVIKEKGNPPGFLRTEMAGFAACRCRPRTAAAGGRPQGRP